MPRKVPNSSESRLVRSPWYRLTNRKPSPSANACTDPIAADSWLMLLASPPVTAESASAPAAHATK